MRLNVLAAILQRGECINHIVAAVSIMNTRTSGEVADLQDT